MTSTRTDSNGGQPTDARADRLAGALHAAELVAVAHRAVRHALAPGVTEQELWAEALQAMERVAGGPVEAEVDLMTGERTALVGVPPASHAVRTGDPVLFDVAPCRDGWYADSCATFVCGKPAAALRRRHDAVRRALDTGIASARPGARAADVDAAVRMVLAEAGLVCPHHTGHGVGTDPQQAPWLLPDAGAVLDEGMIVAIEPGAYADGFGVRLEHLVVIDIGGGRPLTTHSLDLI